MKLFEKFNSVAFGHGLMFGSTCGVVFNSMSRWLIENPDIGTNVGLCGCVFVGISAGIGTYKLSNKLLKMPNFDSTEQERESKSNSGSESPDSSSKNFEPSKIV